MDDEADVLRDEIGRLEGLIDLKVDDPELRRRLWDACGAAMMWSWESVPMAQEALSPVRNHFDTGPAL